jgi:hypothetical protein
MPEQELDGVAHRPAQRSGRRFLCSGTRAVSRSVPLTPDHEHEHRSRRPEHDRTKHLNAHSRPDLVGRVRVALRDAGDAGEDLPGGVVAAMERVTLDERRLQGWRVSPASSPSMVVSSAPWCITASVRQVLIRRPPTSTVQVPQAPWSQPSLVPSAAAARGAGRGVQPCRSSAAAVLPRNRWDDTSDPSCARSTHLSRGSSRMKLPERRSARVCSISARVFITNGP